jgi:hypothetical protein
MNLRECRRRHPHPEGSQGGVREAAIARRWYAVADGTSPGECSHNRLGVPDTLCPPETGRDSYHPNSCIRYNRL